MSRSLKLKNNDYIDVENICINREKLSSLVNNNSWSKILINNSSDSYVWYKKINSIVFVNFAVWGEINLNQNQVIATLPENFRPLNTTPFCLNGMSGDASKMWGRVETNGDIRCGDINSNSYFSANICFPSI